MDSELRATPGTSSSDQTLQTACHPACVACRPVSEGGLGLCFEGQPDGSVVGTFECAPAYQSYPDRLHGGLAALLLDAAMTHCLFHHGVAGVTGRLDVRFREPVAVGEPAEIRAVIEDADPRIYRLRAEVHQGGVLRVHAIGKFAPHPTGGH